ncbi:hypothetical protein ACFVFQ_37620 [Streptomyces sp. NPDC057743]
MKPPRIWLDEHGIGWRQIAAQVLYVDALTVLMVVLLVGLATH